MHEHPHEHDIEDYDYGFGPQVGQPAPVFEELTTYHQGEFKTASLAEYEGKWLVLFFYPRDFTFICPTEIQEFGENYDNFLKLNCEVIAASTDSEHSHKAWFETDERLKGVKYPIIADTTQELADAFNVLDDDGAAQRGTFIVDPEGILRYVLVSDGSVGRNTQEILRVVEALQTGERCPANWHKGDSTLGKD
jgi:alkyl hydroperoxide reductase subunit AhpC